MFSFEGFDRRKIFTVLMFVMIIALLANGGFERILLTLPGVIIAMTFHEFAHAWMADKLGDTTPRAQGRLTLNPVSHLDPVRNIFIIICKHWLGKAC